VSDYQIYFQQTANERYETDMNESVRQLIVGAGIEIVEEYGGTALNVPPDQLGSECGFVVRAPLAKISEVSSSISAALGNRAVDFSEAD
jgi:hypothetical protein